jgi:hypothetical protein
MTGGVKSMALATALALMTIGMGSAVTAAERQNVRGCAGPTDCGGSSLRSNDRLRSGGGQNELRRSRPEAKDAGGDLKTLKTEQPGRSSLNKRRLITKDDNDRVDDNSSNLLRKRQFRNRNEDRPRAEGRVKKKQQHAHGGWKFDKKKHKRQKHRSKWFPYYYAGFYYPSRYWLFDHDPYYSFDPSRVSCGEGRDIVRESGYSRVSTVECVGTTYTYLGRRSGETYRITLNARTGDIISRKRTS